MSATGSVLRHLRRAQMPHTVLEIAMALGQPPKVVYASLRTLEHHQMARCAGRRELDRGRPMVWVAQRREVSA